MTSLGEKSQVCEAKTTNGRKRNEAFKEDLHADQSVFFFFLMSAIKLKNKNITAGVLKTDVQL